MLVLTRKKGQKLVIGDNIEIVIIESDFNNVKIGVNAPKSVTVYREEVYLEIKKQNELSNLSDLSEINNLLKTCNNITKTPIKSILIKK